MRPAILILFLASASVMFHHDFACADTADVGSGPLCSMGHHVGHASASHHMFDRPTVALGFERALVAQTAAFPVALEPEPAYGSALFRPPIA